MKDKETREGKNIINIVLICLILFLVIIFGYINLVQYKIGLNADIAAEGLLAREIWESKEWIPSDWYFSSESKLVGVTNLAAIIYGMTQSMCLAMGAGCIVGIVFILWSIYFLCRELEFNNTQKLWMILLILLLPNSKGQLELLYLFAGYYTFYVGVYFITLSFYIRLIKGKKIKWHGMIVLFLLHFIMGAQGVRGILMIAGPLAATEVVRRVYLLYCKRERRKEDNLITGFVIILNVLGFFGGLLPISVGYPLSRNIRKALQKFFKIVMPDFFAAIDWNNISLIEKIALIGCLLLVLYFVIRIILKGYKKEKIQGDEWVFFNFIVSVFLTIAALTFTTVESSSRYFTIIFIAIAMAIVMLWKRADKIIKGGLIVIVTIILMGNSSRVYFPMIIDKSFENNDYVKVCDYLIEEGYENAYTTFEHANVMTLSGDGEVQISAVASMSTMEVCKWLSCRKWYVPNVSEESKTAYIVTPYKMSEIEEFLREHEEVVLKHQIGIYSIYGADYNYSKLTD